jgi:steroid delta-isomerase-like uncharacterized protein
MATNGNIATVTDMLDAAWNRGDTTAIDRTVCEHHIDHDPDGDQIGRIHLADAVREYRAAFPDLHMSFDHQIAEGGTVVTRWTASGTHQGDFRGIAATGRSATIAGVFIHRLADGQIAETWTAFDQLGLLRQLGIASVPATASPPGPGR